ncbi:MAG TPA: right-handed parallel beta-helix repeat-containing protein, partial [Geodermatophilus sp.]|nr:right-handed parallel beta-helix repeat-containing protein [Geodermatophilus sp.]
PETPDTPETPETPDTPETPETPETPDTPETPETPDTTERVSGICIIGDVELGETEIVVRDAVEETDVSGITVEGAAGDGLIAVGTRDLEVRDSTFRNNAGYGAASFATAGTEETPGTTFQGNTAADNAEAGFYVGDSPEAHAQVSGNESRGNELGLFFRSASNGEATNNIADGNCLGVLVLADAPGPATDWTLRDNEVTENNKACDVVVPLSGGGIALVGAQDFVVSANTVTGNQSSAESLLEGGIIVRSGLTPEEVTPPEAEPPTEPAPPVTEPSGTVSGNTVLDNEPDDLVHDGTGEVTFEDNRCETSDPEGLCD